MSDTTKQFKELIETINESRKKEKLMIENFEKSNCELSECFHQMIQDALNGRDFSILYLDICPELYAKELSGMNFKVEKFFGTNNIFTGYIVCWDNGKENSDV